MSKTAYELLRSLSHGLGIGRGAVLELALRTLYTTPPTASPELLKFNKDRAFGEIDFPRVDPKTGKFKRSR